MISKFLAGLAFLGGLFAFGFKRKAEKQEAKANRLQDEVNHTNTINRASNDLELEREKIKEEHRKEDINDRSNNRRDSFDNDF